MSLEVSGYLWACMGDYCRNDGGKSEDGPRKMHVFVSLDSVES